MSPQAAGGIDAEPGAHVLVAASPEECRDTVLWLLDDPAERARLARAGRRRALERHAWAASMQRLDGIIERCLLQHHRRRTSPR